MTEQTGWTEPEPAVPVVPPVDVGSAAEDVTPPAPDPSQEPPAESPAPESDTAPEPPAAEPAPEQPAADAPPNLYVPDGQPSWLTDVVQAINDALHLLHQRISNLGG